MDDDNDNSIKLSPEKNTKKSTKRMKDKIKIEESRKSEKDAINNKKGPYYRIEKLPKEDKGKKGKKNLFLNDSLKGSSFQATIKKQKIYFSQKEKRIKIMNIQKQKILQLILVQKKKKTLQNFYKELKK